MTASPGDGISIPASDTFWCKLIVEMATSNPTWGEERIANELLLKIGIQISPRTVRRYMRCNRSVPRFRLNGG
jgi:hypothetical protein